MEACRSVREEDCPQLPKRPAPGPDALARPANHPLIEVVPGLDGPVLLLKDATADKTRPATRLSALTAMGPDAAIRCRCECSYHDVPAAWIAVKLGAGVVFVVWGGHGA
jgi:hypothetical protein